VVKLAFAGDLREILECGPCRSLTWNHLLQTKKGAVDLKNLSKVVWIQEKVLLKFRGDRSTERQLNCHWESTNFANQGI